MITITLPSNASMDLFPQNTCQDYTTQLASDLNLNGNFEVALKRLQYPYNWSGLEGDDCKVKFSYKSFKAKTPITEEIQIPEVDYTNVAELVSALITAIYTQTTDPHFQEIAFQLKGSRLWVSLKSGVKIEFSNRVRIILGFVENPGWVSEASEINHFFSNDYDVDIRGGRHTLFVYSDIVEHSIVGDTIQPLLGTASIGGSPGNIVVYEPQILDWTSLRSNEIRTIRIYIRDEVGEVIPFKGGRVIVTLHLRKRPIF